MMRITVRNYLPRARDVYEGPKPKRYKPYVAGPNFMRPDPPPADLVRLGDPVKVGGPGGQRGRVTQVFSDGSYEVAMQGGRQKVKASNVVKTQDDAPKFAVGRAVKVSYSNGTSRSGKIEKAEGKHGLPVYFIKFDDGGDAWIEEGRLS